MNSSGRRTALAVTAAILALGVIAAVAVAHRSDKSSGNPFVGARPFVDRDSDAYWARQNLLDQGRLREARAMAKIANHPWASWFGDWSSGHGSFYADVKARVDEIVAARSLPVLVAYDIPLRDCGEYSAGGARGPAAYRSWLSALRRGIGSRRAVVILEPDALAGLDCLSPREQRQRIALLRAAVEMLSAAPSISVYIDAGNESWHSPQTMAKRLKAVGIDRARGFALNVSNFYSVRSERAYGDRLSSLVGGKPFVIDTSRNGRGPAPGHVWCNPPGRGLGLPATTKTHDRLVDAFLWIKPPGESDGTCRGGPQAGEWWLHYALGLAKRAAF